MRRASPEGVAQQHGKPLMKARSKNERPLNDRRYFLQERKYLDENCAKKRSGEAGLKKANGIDDGGGGKT